MLNDHVKPNVIATKEPELYRRISDIVGEAEVAKAEKHVMLLQIDKCWADHLDYVSYVKEGIHLESISNKNPLDEYNRLITRVFDQLDETIEAAIIGTFRSMSLTKGSIDFDMEELRAPSATWTYIINDQFFPNRVSLF
ncbi:preprotein translocase subunit SecA [compost metagenome]